MLSRASARRRLSSFAAFQRVMGRRALSSGGAAAAEHAHGAEDEYKQVAHAGARSAVFRPRAPLALESGVRLEGVEVAYTTYGELNEARDNVLVLCHALTGDALVHQYWDAMVAPRWTDKYFVVCSNVLGSCYGTTGPASVNPATGKRYGAAFPAVTMRDAVALQKRLLQEELGVNKVREYGVCAITVDSSS